MRTRGGSSANAANDAEVGDRDDRNFRVGHLVEHGHDRRLVERRDVAHAAGLHPFQRERDALSDADAHGRQRMAAAAPLQFLGRGQREARAGHAERMAERDRAAVGVHLGSIVGEPELAQHREALRGEGLVQFDHVEVADLQAEALQQFLATPARGRCP